MSVHEFRAVVQDGCIRIPEEYAAEIPTGMTVTVRTEGPVRAAKKSDRIPYYPINTEGYRFDREEANERR